MTEHTGMGDELSGDAIERAAKRVHKLGSNFDWETCNKHYFRRVARDLISETLGEEFAIVSKAALALPDPVVGETIQTLLDLLNPLHGELDRQTYDDKLHENFDAPRDAEYHVNITAQMERDLTQAVLILEDRKRQSALATERVSDQPSGEKGDYALVPRKPTEKMIEAGCEYNPTQFNEGTPDGFLADVANDVYVAMVRASPALPEKAVAWREADAFVDAIDARIEGKTRCNISAEEWIKLSASICDVLAARPDNSAVVKAREDAIEECATAAHKIVEKYEAKSIEKFKKPGEWEARASRTAADLIEMNIRALSAHRSGT